MNEIRHLVEMWRNPSANPQSKLMLWSGTAMRLGLCDGDSVGVRYIHEDGGYSGFSSKVTVNDTITFEHVRIDGCIGAKVNTEDLGRDPGWE